jgi:hypothetical protein
MRALRRALQVERPVAGNLKLPRYCTASWAGTDKCAAVGQMCNGQLPEAIDSKLFGDFQCALLLIALLLIALLLIALHAAVLTCCISTRHYVLRGAGAGCNKFPTVTWSAGSASQAPTAARQ